MPTLGFVPIPYPSVNIVLFGAGYHVVPSLLYANDDVALCPVTIHRTSFHATPLPCTEKISVPKPVHVIPPSVLVAMELPPCPTATVVWPFQNAPFARVENGWLEALVQPDCPDLTVVYLTWLPVEDSPSAIH